MDFEILYEKYRMNTKQISDYFEIPYITVHQWKSGKRRCAEYLLKLMVYKLENENKK